MAPTSARRSDRHREHRLPGADRLAPRREHAQPAGAGVRQRGRAAHPDHRRRPALLVAAAKARHWLPIRARTDLALLLAWMNVLVQREPVRPRVRRPTRPRLRQVRAEIKATRRVGGAETGLEANQIASRARVRPPPPARLIHPRPARDWNGGRRAAQPGDRTGQRPARKLGPARRHLPEQQRQARLLSAAEVPDLREAGGRQPQLRALPFAHEAVTPASARRRSPASRTRSRAGGSIRATSSTPSPTRRRR